MIDGFAISFQIDERLAIQKGLTPNDVCGFCEAFLFAEGFYKNELGFYSPKNNKDVFLKVCRIVDSLKTFKHKELIQQIEVFNLSSYTNLTPLLRGI